MRREICVREEFLSEAKLAAYFNRRAMKIKKIKNDIKLR